MSHPQSCLHSWPCPVMTLNGLPFDTDKWSASEDQTQIYCDHYIDVLVSGKPLQQIFLFVFIYHIKENTNRIQVKIK